MTTEEIIIARAREILLTKPSWTDDNNQILTELSTIMGVGVDKAAYESHSDRNEFYSDTAQLDSSLLAKASDEGRIPNRPLPQILTCSITSETYQEFTEDSTFISDLGIKYLIPGTVIVEAGETVQGITFRQEEKKAYSYIPTTEEWQEFIAGSKETTRFELYVNNQLWENFEDLGELENGANGYVTRYNIYDQLYTRTGNGFLGKIPDGQVDIISYDTKAQDIQVGASLYTVGVDVEIKVTAIAQNSQLQESAQSVAKSLPFWRLKTGGNGYETDYITDIVGEFPEALVINVWSEKKASASYNRDNINVIFVSALRQENQVTFGVKIIDFLKSKKNIMQVNFEWREPIQIASSISVTGKIERTKVISTGEAAIKAAIVKYYGLYAAKADRKKKVYKSNVNDIITATGVFANLLPNKERNEEPKFEVEITGSQIPASGREIIYIPIENITTNITKVDNT